MHLAMWLLILMLLKGVYEISNKCARFIPANNTKLLVVITLAGFIIRSLMHGKKK